MPIPSEDQQYKTTDEAELSRIRRILESALSEQLKSDVTIRWTNNRVTMISFKRKDQGVSLRLHRMFALAPKNVVTSLGSFVSKEKGKGASKVLDDFIAQNNHLIVKKKRRILRKSVGRWHDLRDILDTLNEQYFSGKFSGGISWGRKNTRGKKRSSIRLGSYLATEKLIIIHPSLDRSFVPKFFVEWVVFHEMLHQKVPITRKNGRRSIHPSHFRDLESCFVHHEKAKQWEKDNIDRLLKY